MTIYFNGHSFKYEIEGVCKLFFPLMRFNFGYDAPSLEELRPEGDYLYTVRRMEGDRTRLFIQLRWNGQTRQGSAELPNDIGRYENECERRLCVMAYNLLSEQFGVRPSWGILTGVRPVNIIQKERKAGRSDEEILLLLGGDYLVSGEKLSLAFETADVQRTLLENLPERSYSLYAGIPFCVSRCSYCSFVSHAITTRKATDRIDDYVRLLCDELAHTAKLAGELGLTLDTIYVGGGTPTALSAEQLQTVLAAIGENFDTAAAREYTVEAGRADTITREKLNVIKRSGADRVSVNPQTFNDHVLETIGRKHTAAQAVDAYCLAREAGFDIVNMDFIAGLPEDSYESFCATIDRAISLEPANITVHTLSIKRSADLFSAEGIEEIVRTDVTNKMTAYAREKLIAAGYRPYYLYRQKNTVGNLENVGYAKPGTESLYNVYIMDEIQTILACGAGGVTKLIGTGENPIRRVFNYKYHFEYIDRYDEILSRKGQVRDFYGQQ